MLLDIDLGQIHLQRVRLLGLEPLKVGKLVRILEHLHVSDSEFELVES